MVFTLVIVSIMAFVSMDMISHIFNEYAYTSKIHRMQGKLDNTVSVLARRMGYMVRESIIARNSHDESFVAINNKMPEHDMYEWIGSDYEGMIGDGTSRTIDAQKNMMGWSGFVDINASQTSATQLLSSGSHFSVAHDLIYFHSHDTYRLNASYDVGIVFKTDTADVFSGYGWGSTHEHAQIFRVKSSGENILLYEPGSKPSRVYEQYALVWSAYGVRVKNGNLIMSQNYRPWLGERYIDATQTLLLENVQMFEVFVKEGLVHFVLCVKDEDISLCKEKAIF